MNAKKILVVEDDLALSAGLCFELDTSGYLTVAAYGCQKARYFLENEHFLTSAGRSRRPVRNCRSSF